MLIDLVIKLRARTRTAMRGRWRTFPDADNGHGKGITCFVVVPYEKSYRTYQRAMYHDLPLIAYNLGNVFFLVFFIFGIFLTGQRCTREEQEEEGLLVDSRYRLGRCNEVDRSVS